MPGRLMAEHTTKTTTGTSQVKGASSATTYSQKPNGVSAGHDAEFKPDKRAEVQHAPNTNGNVLSRTDDELTATGTARSLERLPPEIDHITLNYQPLSKLFERVAQECYNSLETTVTSLASVHNHSQANGDGPSTLVATVSVAGAEKRVKWLEFANTNRERFIKLLVILQWSRNIGDVSKIIDLGDWTRKRGEMYENTVAMMANLKRELHPEKIPNPDLETALEILSSGQSARMPDLGYILPEPLSAPKLLETLANINTLLHIRINLHEDLPFHFRNFRIASGRATFTVPTEFELDLSIADEDPASQFYFIYFRFLFTPCSEIPAGQLRSQLEGRANEVLAGSGLSGCYEFFHDFVLTYKISGLRHQALDLARTTWAGSLRVEQLHRSLVIQYWTNRNGPKSWIEIGVRSGRRVGAKPSQPRDRQPQIGVKWMRMSRDVGYLNADQLQFVNLDVEEILRSVVAQHISYILSSVQFKLLALGCPAEFASPMDVAIPLPFSSAARLGIEPTTGRLTLSPPTTATLHCEEVLESLPDPAEQAASSLASYTIVEISHTLRDAAARVGWTQLRGLDEKGTVAAIANSTGLVIKHASVFQPWRKSTWVIITSIGSNGNTLWWVANYVDARSPSCILDSMESIPVEAPSVLSATFFSNVRRFALWILSSHSIMTRLKQLEVPSVIHEPPPWKGFSITPPTILMKTATLLNLNITQASLFSSTVSIALLKPNSFETSNEDGQVIHIVKGCISDSTSFLRLLSRSPTSSAAFDRESGGFALHISSPLGSSRVIDVLVQRLTSLGNLRGYLNIVNSRGFNCTAASLERMTFIYATLPSSADPNMQPADSTPSSKYLTAIINFMDEGLKATFLPKTNPHIHLAPLLTEILNSIPSDGGDAINSSFSTFSHALSSTLPILRSFENLEGGPMVHLRGMWAFKLAYHVPQVEFAITYRTRFGRQSQQQSQMPAKGMWHIETRTDFRSNSESVRNSLAAFWTREGIGAGQDAVALKAGLACTLKAVGGVLGRLDEVVRSLQGVNTNELEVENGTNGSGSLGLKQSSSGGEGATGKGDGNGAVMPGSGAVAGLGLDLGLAISVSTPGKEDKTQKGQKTRKKETEVITLD